MTLYEVTDKLVINPKPKEWFGLEPLQQVQVRDWIDLSQPHFFVIVEFDLDDFSMKAKADHPNWSYEKCRNECRWKGPVQTMLRAEIKKEMKNTGCDLVTQVPEQMGVNVVATAKNLGVLIETKPKDRIFKIALMGRSSKNTAPVPEEQKLPKKITGLRRFERSK